MTGLKQAFAVFFVLLAAGCLCANARNMTHEAIKTSLRRLVESVENEDLDGVKDYVSPRFLEGNPEIPGRLLDSFEKFDDTKIEIKIAGIQDADEIAAVKLNWVKTTTNPMNNWRYRDIGNDVIFYFSLKEPHQLVGMDDPSLFGVSFLLTSRIVMPMPNQLALDAARKEIELKEKKLALDREEQERAREKADREAKAKEDELNRKKEEQARADAAKREKEMWLAREKEEKEEKARAATAAKEAEQEAEKIRAQEKTAGKAKKDKTPEGQAAKAVTDDELEQVLALGHAAPVRDVGPDREIGDSRPPAVAKGSPPLKKEPDRELVKAISEKADRDAKALMEKRKDLEKPVAPPPPVEETPPPPVESPELQKWREEKLREIHAFTSDTAAWREKKLKELDALGVASPAPVVEPAVVEPSVAETTLPAGARTIREIEQTAMEDDVRADSETKARQFLKEKKVKERKPETTPAAAAPKAEKKDELKPDDAEIQRAKQAAKERIEAVSDLDDLDQMLKQTQAGEKEAPKTEKAKPPAAKPLEVAGLPTGKGMAEDIRTKSDQEAREMLVEKRAGLSTQAVPEKAVTPTPEQAPVSEVKEEQPGSEKEPAAQPPPAMSEKKDTTVVEVAVSAPAAFKPVPPAAVPEAGPVGEPAMCQVRGGEQPGGPMYNFQMATVEVANRDFCEFLNSARRNPYNAQGAHMVVDDDGNIFMDTTTNKLKRLFSMTDLDFGGTQTGIIFDNGQYRPADDKADHPVVGVSWYGALKYCNWLTVKYGGGEDKRAYAEGVEPEQWHPANVNDKEWAGGFSDAQRQNWLETCSGFRLPMNNYNSTTGKYNEFFLAAAWNGKDNNVFGFGRNSASPELANYRDSGDPFDNGTTPVGYYDGTDHDGQFATQDARSPFGLYDLSGNVWEWSNDTTGNIAYRALFGGSFEGDVDSLRASYRGSINPYNTCANVGFRVVRSQPPAPKSAAAK